MAHAATGHDRRRGLRGRRRALAGRAARAHAAALSAALRQIENDLPERTLNRRAKMRRPGESLVDGTDLPVAPDYLEAVAATGASPRKQSRWLNAASFDATAAAFAPGLIAAS